MRITNSMMVSQFLTDANSSLNRLSKYQNQVDSTRRVSNISDDPQATITALKARNKLSSLKAYQGNIQMASGYLKEAESAAYSLNQILQTVYERVITATGGGKSQEDWDAIAAELSSLQEEIVSIGNSKIGTSYVFGGYNFTGSSDGVVETPPFSINSTNGHLIYNGIDLSQISWAEDYEKNTVRMTAAGSVILEKGTQLASGVSDEYARDTVCAEALKAMQNLLASGEAALEAARNFGIDPGCEAYQKLSRLLYGVGEKGEPDYIAGLSQLSADLFQECTKELEKNMENPVNAFSQATAQAILDAANELIGNTSDTEGLSYSMAEAIAALKAEIDADTAYTNGLAALAAEQDNQAVVYIGDTQTVAFTFPGTMLVGAGTDNTYYVIGKCVSLLKSGNMDALSDMISEVQQAQSRALCFETELGTTMNRLDLISSRYDSSEINYTGMKSNAIDVDMAEAILNLTTAKTVYSAALAAGAKIIQTSLIDFLR